MSWPQDQADPECTKCNGTGVIEGRREELRTADGEMVCWNQLSGDRVCSCVTPTEYSPPLPNKEGTNP